MDDNPGSREQRIRLGIEEMDNQHLMLLEVADHFKCLSDEEDVAKEQLEITLNAIIEYARYHLASEEEYLKSIEYPDLREHIKLHHKLVAKLRGHLGKFREGELTASQLFNFMEEWVIQHIIKEDSRYGAFVRETSSVPVS